MDQPGRPTGIVHKGDTSHGMDRRTRGRVASALLPARRNHRKRNRIHQPRPSPRPSRRHRIRNPAGNLQRSPQSPNHVRRVDRDLVRCPRRRRRHLGQIQLASAQPHPAQVRRHPAGRDHSYQDQTMGEGIAPPSRRRHGRRHRHPAVDDPGRSRRGGLHRQKPLPTPQTQPRPINPERNRQPQRRAPHRRPLRPGVRDADHHRCLHRDAVGRTRRTAMAQRQPRRQRPHYR